MTSLAILRKRNEISQLVRLSNRHRNVLRWSPTESDVHLFMKLQICAYLRKQDTDFMTEAIFEKGEGRADIIVLDQGICIEVVESETEKSRLQKENKYPLPIIFVDAKAPFSEKLIQ